MRCMWCKLEWDDEGHTPTTCLGAAMVEITRLTTEVERLVKANEGWHTRVRQLTLDVEAYGATNEQLRADIAHIQSMRETESQTASTLLAEAQATLATARVEERRVVITDLRTLAAKTPAGVQGSLRHAWEAAAEHLERGAR